MFGIFSAKKENRSKYIGFETDVHSHLLPGIDDGSDDLVESIELIEGLKNLGIKRSIVTPHIADEVFPNNKKTISTAYDLLQNELNSKNIAFDLEYSAEYRLDDGFMALFEQGELMPFPSNYVLIENSYYQPHFKLNEIIFELNVKGFNPILAHPERYVYYHGDYSVYDQIYELNCKLQVNILSLAGVYGKEVKKAAQYLLNSGKINFLGTDTHHLRHVRAIDEFIGTSEYKRILDKVNLENDLI